MAYETKPNTGAMFINRKKTSETSPALIGAIELDKAFIEDLISKSKGPLVKVALFGWNNKAKSGISYMSLIAAEPMDKENKPSSTDDDIPEFMR